ncbi:MAG: hypothetical protein IIY99_01625, partial [Firmicutes bacterium]|nr:hypothetical protein [Bacillota bacterium]
TDETAGFVREKLDTSSVTGDDTESVKDGKDAAGQDDTCVENREAPESEEIPEDTGPENAPALEISGMTIIDTIFDTYILAKDSDNFYMIDQHAAHERIFFEKFRAEYRNTEKATQQVMIPLMIDIPAAAKNSDIPVTEALYSLGFQAEEFGPVTYRITGIPAFMDLDEAERLLRDFIDESPEAEWYQNEEQFLKIATRACKNAIKGKDRTTPEERQQLLTDLSRCENPYSCPHGRPTFIKMTKYQIEKLFKRV